MGANNSKLDFFAVLIDIGSEPYVWESVSHLAGFFSFLPT
jgi:hypothetical protein